VTGFSRRTKREARLHKEIIQAMHLAGFNDCLLLLDIQALHNRIDDA
jgi:hypothetical protein